MRGNILSMDILALLFAVAMLAGFIDSIAGGGGLITIPALLATGFPPALVLGTNKLQACGGSFSASLYFIRKKAVRFTEIWMILLFVFLGAMSGTILIQQIDATVLRNVLPFLIIVIGLYFLISPKLGEQDREALFSYWRFAFTAGLGIGFYDGFLGPGTGSFFSLACIVLLGFNLTKATAYAKVLNFTTNLTSLIFFALGHKILWSAGAVMLIGQFIGANLGARMVITKGKLLIRPMIVIMSFIMSVKMIYEQGWLS